MPDTSCRLISACRRPGFLNRDSTSIIDLFCAYQFSFVTYDASALNDWGGAPLVLPWGDPRAPVARFAHVKSSLHRLAANDTLLLMLLVRILMCCRRHDTIARPSAYFIVKRDRVIGSSHAGQVNDRTRRPKRLLPPHPTIGACGYPTHGLNCPRAFTDFGTVPDLWLG